MKKSLQDLAGSVEEADPTKPRSFGAFTDVEGETAKIDL